MRPRTARGNHPPPAGVPLHRGDGEWTWMRPTGVSRLRNTRPNPRPHPLCGGVPPAGGGVVPRAVRGVTPSAVPAHCAGTGQGVALPVIASRGTLAIRTIETGAAIQCRERNIRICDSYYWIASHL
ncbi:MAG: hypothetical protein LBM98_08945 [Oscillospiraceae bacterium]|nr:hypothetical protein [Oscillospiraceae bacterium]